MIRPRCTLLVALPFFFGCAAHDDAGHDHGSDHATSAFEDAYEQVELGKADGSGCSGVLVPDRHPFAKRVALTFDDGPSTTTTPQVLDILAARGIRATFFVNGQNVSSNAARAVLARILGEGHILANHSQTHDDFADMTSTSEMRDAVRLTDEIVVAAGETRRYFRFPYGSATCSALDVVEGHGLTVTGWHVDSADWCYARGDGYCRRETFEYVPNSYRGNMVGYTLSQIRAKRGGIVLFHDIHQNTVNHLEEILDTLAAEGYVFVNIDDTTVFPLLHGITPPFIGDACSSNEQCGFLEGRCHTFTPSIGGVGGFCTSSCEGTCPDRNGKAPTFCTSLDGGLTGSCVSKAHARNSDCADIPGTTKQRADRFIGSSGASPASADVCLPD